MISTNLPPLYSQAFSLYLSNEHANFSDLRVSGIEWLGKKPKLTEITKAFPNEKITYRNGTAYLIYKNGQKEEI